MPFGTNFLILDLWRASLDRLHEVLLVLPLRQFQRLLNHKVAVVMTDEGEETWRARDFSDKDGSSFPIARLETLFNDTGGVFLDAEL